MGIEKKSNNLIRLYNSSEDKDFCIEVIKKYIEGDECFLDLSSNVLVDNTKLILKISKRVLKVFEKDYKNKISLIKTIKKNLCHFDDFDFVCKVRCIIKERVSKIQDLKEYQEYKNFFTSHIELKGEFPPFQN